MCSFVKNSKFLNIYNLKCKKTAGKFAGSKIMYIFALA